MVDIKKMERTISFGKIDYFGRGRKINEVTIEMRLSFDEDRYGRPVFSCSGNVWNGRKTDIVCGGQCLDELLPFFKYNKLFKEIHGLWKRNHLNDMNVGTPEQLRCIEEHKDEIDESDGWFIKELNLLKKYGMDVVEYEGKLYEYGKGWVYRVIPADDLKRIVGIIKY